MQYLEAWLRGSGCVPIYNLMEDAATAEICRAQVWQWVRHAAKMDNGGTVTYALVQRSLHERMDKMRSALGVAGFEESRFHAAAVLFDGLLAAKQFPPFLTLAAYDELD